jgi:hypothetical protein
MKKSELKELIKECLNEVAFSDEDKALFDTLPTKLNFPYSKGYISTLGGEDRASYMLNVSTTTKDQWTNGILQNSHYGQFRIDKAPQGYVLEHFSGTLPKFRKSVSKTLDELVAKLNAYYTKVTTTK